MEQEQPMKPFFFLMGEETFKLVTVQLHSAVYIVQLLFLSGHMSKKHCIWIYLYL